MKILFFLLKSFFMIFLFVFVWAIKAAGGAVE